MGRWGRVELGEAGWGEWEYGGEVRVREGGGGGVMVEGRVVVMDVVEQVSLRTLP